MQQTQQQKRFPQALVLTVSVLATCVLLGACGLKTAPRPPEATAPVVPGDLNVKTSKDGVRVVWDRAQYSADGQPLDDLSTFVVERRDPASEKWSPVASIDVTDNTRLRKAEKFSWIDREAPQSGASYRVHAVNADGQAGAPGAEATWIAPEPVDESAAVEPTPAAQ